MGKLYIVPTPIGNLEDITFRAVRFLKEAGLILAEDTRVSGKLLKHYGIQTPMESHHVYNEHKTVSKIADRINAGLTVALISDAGTPSVSDPGFLLIRECIKNQIAIECLPGATALIPALVNSGIPSDRFCFEGFLPHKKGRASRLSKLAEAEHTIILYESPFRLVKTLEQLGSQLGFDRKACICRELTKIHEENVRGTLQELYDHFRTQTVKGEIVIVVAGRSV
ncbi:MAG: 16S rRNA (cytidine(1402)-2'-O)-methyltransferase [Bacteroidales bacterium]|nr:16S rRNA (cytidine(1402)-2'-O)-methyltransferase [Bacteroidales bacterium]